MENSVAPATTTSDAFSSEVLASVQAEMINTLQNAVQTCVSLAVTRFGEEAIRNQQEQLQEICRLKERIRNLEESTPTKEAVVSPLAEGGATRPPNSKVRANRRNQLLAALPTATPEGKGAAATGVAAANPDDINGSASVPAGTDQSGIVEHNDNGVVHTTGHDSVHIELMSSSPKTGADRIGGATFLTSTNVGLDTDEPQEAANPDVLPAAAVDSDRSQQAADGANAATNKPQDNELDEEDIDATISTLRAALVDESDLLGKSPGRGTVTLPPAVMQRCHSDHRGEKEAKTPQSSKRLRQICETPQSGDSSISSAHRLTKAAHFSLTPVAAAAGGEDFPAMPSLVAPSGGPAVQATPPGKETPLMTSPGSERISRLRAARLTLPSGALPSRSSAANSDSVQQSPQHGQGVDVATGVGGRPLPKEGCNDASGSKSGNGTPTAVATHVPSPLRRRFLNALSGGSSSAAASAPSQQL
mmetsp:Transcript_137213/g.256187  ORF Transcript_137213/g.256187 Transcript_137213/m.256187 type:complete len:475 (+) Transcript_137213:41-1465(+)